MSNARRRNASPRQPRSQPVLQNRLVSLWRKLAANRQPPAIDRFLARELGRLDGLGRRDRLWLGDLLTDGLRFGALTVFAETWRRDIWQSGATVAERLVSHTLPDGDGLWRRLRRLPVPVVFFWTFMRKRLNGTELPAIAPPGPLATEVWRTLREQAPGSPDPGVRALWAGLPPALLPQLTTRASASGWTAERLLTFLDRHALRPPVGLRILRPEATTALAAELAAAGFSCEQQGAGFMVQGEGGVFELPGYRSGQLEIQDLASQAIGEAVAARPGQLIWDCCAGAGGKSVQLAAGMRGRGAILATDLQESKLKDLRRRAKRARLANIKTETWSGDGLPDFSPEVAAHGGFDCVLVDAHCSGSGTWRRNVDGRLRFDAGTVNSWVEVQSGLLDLVAASVRPDGRLVYGTCSWLVAENEAVCETFLARHPQWRLQTSCLAGNPDIDSDTTFHAVFTRAQ